MCYFPYDILNICVMLLVLVMKSMCHLSSGSPHQSIPQILPLPAPSKVRPSRRARCSPPHYPPPQKPDTLLHHVTIPTHLALDCHPSARARCSRFLPIRTLVWCTRVTFFGGPHSSGSAGNNTTGFWDAVESCLDWCV
jgi:hypothetical protein